MTTLAVTSVSAEHMAVQKRRTIAQVVPTEGIDDPGAIAQDLDRAILIVGHEYRNLWKYARILLITNLSGESKHPRGSWAIARDQILCCKDTMEYLTLLAAR